MTISNPVVYIIVLNWNGKADTLECLHSIKSIRYDNFVTVVVDNGSTDGSEKEITTAFPDVTFIEAGDNLGYAEGNNVGIRHAIEQEASYVFVLNNDTTVDGGILSALVREAEKNPKAAILGPKIYFYDRPDVINSAGGSIDYQTLQRSHIGYGIRDDGSAHASPSPVEWTTGCAFLARVSALREVGLFDRDFFLICEELDLCLRMRKRGYEIVFVPEAKLWHKVSAAFEGNYSPVYCYYMFRNILLYVRKNFSERRLSLYRKLLKESIDFYIMLRQKGDPDYLKKGFCILIGTLHFFAGAYGRAPKWLFKLQIPKRKPVVAERDADLDLFKAEIQVGAKPVHGKAGAKIHLPVSVKNMSTGTWPASSPDAVHLSYHLRNESGTTVTWDGTRTELQKDLPSGKVAKLDAVVELPQSAGTYLVEFDLVQETVAWFSSKGQMTASFAVVVE